MFSETSFLSQRKLCFYVLKLIYFFFFIQSDAVRKGEVYSELL